MSPELDKILVEKYPKLFRDRNGDMMKTAMCWGFEHGDGWFWILDNLCDSIQNYIDQNNKWSKEKVQQVIVTQVKEKFGSLCFYFNGGDSYIDGMVSLAENLSYKTCEFCGSMKEVGRTMGWISTICKECFMSSPERINNREWKYDNKIYKSETLIRKEKLHKIN
jgi:hypothetical protein